MTANDGEDPTRVRMMEWSVKHGSVVLSFPHGMSAADADDVEKIFAIALRTIRRRAAHRDPTPTEVSHDPS